MDTGGKSISDARREKKGRGDMSLESLKNALIRGIPMGLVFVLAYAAIRMVLNGGSYFSHLISLYGILTMICVPAAWVLYYYDKEKKEKEKRDKEKR